MLSRRSLLFGGTASLLLTSGCFPLLALSRIMIRRGVARQLARASMSRGLAVSATGGRLNTFASRLFDARYRVNRQLSESRAQDSLRNRTARIPDEIVSQLVEYSLSSDEIEIVEDHQGLPVAVIKKIDNDTIECRMSQTNVDIISWKQREDLLVHYDMYGNSAGFTRIESPTEHRYYSDISSRSVKAEDIIRSDKVDHTHLGSFIGSSTLIDRDSGALIQNTPDLSANISLILNPSRSDDAQVLRQQRRTLRECMFSNRERCSLTDFID